MKKRTTNQLTNQRTNKPSDAATAAQLMEQYRVAVAADVAAARQKLKFGAMLALWANYLGESRGGACGTSDGGGLKGWLAENCPEIAYTAAMNYKYKAEKAAEMLGGGMRAMASLLSLCNEAPGDAIQIEAPGDVIELTEKERDAAIKLCENVESLGQLEQMYFDFMAKETAKEKRKKAGGGGSTLPKISKQEAAERIWARLSNELMAKTARDAVLLLPAKTAGIIHGQLLEIMKMLKAQMEVKD